MVYRGLFVVAAALMTVGAFGGTVAIMAAQQSAAQVQLA